MLRITYHLHTFTAVCGLLSSLLLTTPVPAQTPDIRNKPSAKPPALRLVPLRDALRRDAPGGDLAKIGETRAGKGASSVGLNLATTDAPVVAAALRDGRLFYVFYKVVEEAFGSQAWVLQRIRKVERTWATADSPPVEKVTYQVEAFKTHGGSLKGADQHFGSFSLGTAHRREVIKEYEIGFGTVPGKTEGAAWPFEITTLYRMMQPYGDDRTLYDQVRFTSARPWTLSVSFAKDGTWAVRSPELALDLPAKVPALSVTQATLDPLSLGIVLTPGAGPDGLQVGVSTRADVDYVLGKALEDVPVGTAWRTVSYDGGLTCNFGTNRILSSLFTRQTFAGQTSLGISHGNHRDAVRAKHGPPTKGDASSPIWTYPGAMIYFRSDDTVYRIIITQR